MNTVTCPTLVWHDVTDIGNAFILGFSGETSDELVRIIDNSDLFTNCFVESRAIHGGIGPWMISALNFSSVIIVNMETLTPATLFAIMEFAPDSAMVIYYDSGHDDCQVLAQLMAVKKTPTVVGSLHDIKHCLDIFFDIQSI